MREIKFRAWDSINKIWIDPFKLILMRCGSVQSVESLDGEIYGTHQVFLNQYTGLKDRNGKEIYEGDVLRGYGSAIKRFVVSFSNGSFVLYHNFGRWGLLSRIFEIEELPVEIIGNLYENPELLNQ